MRQGNGSDPSSKTQSGGHGLLRRKETDRHSTESGAWN